MEEPDIKIESKIDGKKHKKSSVIKIVLIIFAVFVVIVGCGIFYLKSTYSGDYLKSICESEIKNATGGECNIDSIDWSITGSVNVSGFSLSLDKSLVEDKPQFLKINKIQANVEIINSIINFQPVITLNVDGVDLNIARVVRDDTVLGQQISSPSVSKNDSDLSLDPDNKFSTNIHNLLASFAELPWKDLVADFNWKIADVDAKINNVKVDVRDQSGSLADMNFTLDLSARLKKTGLNINGLIGQETPEVKSGKVELLASVIFDWNAAAARKDKPLAFIGSTNININIKDLDVGYIGKYYIQSEEQLIRLGKPLSGNISIKAKDLSSVNFNIDMNSKKIIELYRDNKLINGSLPGFKLNLKAEADMSQEWSNIKNGYVDISSTDSENNVKWFEINTQISGSFGNEIVTSIQGNVNTGVISDSALGKAFDFYNIARGDIVLGSELTWKKNDDWMYDFNIRSKDLVIKNNGTPVNAPIAMLMSGSVKTLDQFTPESLSLQIKCKAPGVEINTASSQGVVIPLNSDKLTLQGEAKAQINMPKVFMAFQEPLSKFGLKSIDEVLELTFKVDKSNSVNIVAKMINTKNLYAPCEVELVYQPKDNNKFIGSFEVSGEKKAVQIKASVDGVKNAGGATTINFTKQFALRIGAGINLIKRIQNLIPGLDVAQYPVAGVMRGTVKGKAVIDKDQVSIVANNSILAEKVIFTTDSGRKFIDHKTSITGSFSIRDLLNSKILNVKLFKVKGDTADIDFKVQQIDISQISKNLLQGLDSIKDLSATVKLGQKTFNNIYALFGDSVPPVIKTGKNLILEIKSDKNGSIALNKFDLDSTGVVASVSDLVVNPKKIIDALNSNDFTKISASLSPFNIKVKAGANFWKGLELPQGMKFSGDAELAMSFDPKADRLTLSKFVLAGDKNNKLFVTRLSAAVIVDNVTKIIQSPALPLILESLPRGVNIPVVTISIPLLQKYLIGSGAKLNLKGRDIELSNLRIVKSSKKGTIQLAGDINSSGVGLDDMLVYKGTTKLNNLITLDGSDIAATGELNFDNAQIKFKATPYVYNKAAKEKVKFYYKLDSNSSGLINVYRAGIKGGALQFDLQKLKYQPKDDGKFIFSLPQFRVLAPVNLIAKNIDINPDANIVKASVISDKMNLDNMSRSLDTGLPSKLSGYIGAMNLSINDKYTTLFGGVNQRMGVENKFAMNPSSVSLKSTTSSVSMTVDVGKINGNSNNGKLVVGGLSITSPSEFSDATPIKVGQIESTFDMNSLAQGKNIIDEMIVSSFKAIYEMKVNGNSISALQKNIDALLPSSNAETSVKKASNVPASSQKESSEIKSVKQESDSGVLIRNLYLNNGVVNIKSKIINTDVKLPQTHVENVGGDNPRVAFTTVLNIMLRSIGKAAVSILDNSAGTAVKSVTNILGNALNNKDKSGSEGDSSNDEESTVKSVTNLLDSVINNDSEGSNKEDGGASGSNLLNNLFK